ncbi:glycosyltransferase [Rhizorhabdus argentea]|uniref:glycosyltransferase n=1 Tax=Rhizorhabdus argentea TaxID=1387174 RepID=UPI0030EBCB43
MRIAYVINSMEGGGAATPLRSVAQVLQSRGAALRVIALTPRDRLALPALLETGLDVVVRPGGEDDHLAALRWLDAQVRDWGATHVWTSLTRATLMGQMVGLWRHLPVISWQHNAHLKPANERLLRLMRRLSSLWIGDSECVTELTARRLKVAPDRLMCWPIFSADPAAPQARPWQPGQMIRLGSLGRLHPNKGYDVLIAALAILKAEGFAAPMPFEIAIAGEGAQRVALEAAITGEGLANIRLAGFTQRPAHFLAGLHLYLQPSRAEGFCIAAHEAMQAGVGVIASAVGEMQYSVDNRCGALVPPGDPDALARALRNMLLYPDMLGSLGEAARRRVRDRYSREAFTARGQEILQRMSAL